MLLHHARQALARIKPGPTEAMVISLDINNQIGYMPHRLRALAEPRRQGLARNGRNRRAVAGGAAPQVPQGKPEAPDGCAMYSFAPQTATPTGGHSGRETASPLARGFTREWNDEGPSESPSRSGPSGQSGRSRCRAGSKRMFRPFAQQICRQPPPPDPGGAPVVFGLFPSLCARPQL